MDGFLQFQQNFEEEANKRFEEYSLMTEDTLIELINKKDWDSTYQIWQAIGVIGTPNKSIPVLFKIVSNLKDDYYKDYRDYLIRYHAGAALFKIAKIDDEEFKGKVQYGRDANKNKIDQVVAINDLKLKIAKYL